MASQDSAAVENTWRRWIRPPRLYGVLVVAALGAFLLSRLGGNDKPAPAYETVSAETGDVVSRVSASGTLAAMVTVEVGSQVSGRIQSLFVDFNSPVRKGQRIGKIDPALFEAAAAQAEANVAASRGNLLRLQVQAEEAARQARRTSQLFEQRLVSENDRDNAESNRRAAEAAVAQAEGQLAQTRAALQQAQTNLRYTDILAPTDGIVISRAVNVGQTVAASLQAPVIFTIAQDLRLMEVHTNVAESDIGKLKAGMEATFTVDAWPGEPFRGRIREIRNAPQIVQNVVTYDAVIDVQNQDLRLKPGMTATVNVVVERRDGVLRVPSAALRFRPDALPSAAAGGSAPRAGPAAAERGRAVWVLAGGSPARRAVTPGITDGSFTEIRDGELKPGETVIVGLAGAAGAGGRGGARPGFRIL
jgi:HlyD family secretion protein